MFEFINFLDDPIRCCEINCTKIGSKEKCPQACKHYDRDDICGKYKTCSIHLFELCPTKCFNVIENQGCQYPDWDDDCPITCGKLSFPGNTSCHESISQNAFKLCLTSYMF